MEDGNYYNIGSLGEQLWATPAGHMNRTLVMQENSELKTVFRRMNTTEAKAGLVIIRKDNHRGHGNSVATTWHIMCGG